MKKQKPVIVGLEKEPKNFRELIELLYDAFPNGFYSNELIRKVIVPWGIIDFLVKHAYLYEMQTSGGKYYGLGPNSLVLISAWETEKAAKNTRKLTYIITLLTVAVVILTIKIAFFP